MASLTIENIPYGTSYEYYSEPDQPGLTKLYLICGPNGELRAFHLTKVNCDGTTNQDARRLSGQKEPAGDYSPKFEDGVPVMASSDDLVKRLHDMIAYHEVEFPKLLLVGADVGDFFLEDEEGRRLQIAEIHIHLHDDKHDGETSGLACTAYLKYEDGQPGGTLQVASCTNFCSIPWAETKPRRAGGKHESHAGVLADYISFRVKNNIPSAKL